MTKTLARKFHRLGFPPYSGRGALMARLRSTLGFFVSLCALVAAGAFAACATTDVNHSKPARASQDQCCTRLADPNAKQACLADIPRTQDETSNINQETFQCVEKHFACDSASG